MMEAARVRALAASRQEEASGLEARVEALVLEARVEGLVLEVALVGSDREGEAARAGQTLAGVTVEEEEGQDSVARRDLEVVTTTEADLEVQVAVVVGLAAKLEVDLAVAEVVEAVVGLVGAVAVALEVEAVIAEAVLAVVEGDLAAVVEDLVRVQVYN